MQEQIQKGLVNINKILKSESPADVLTEYVDGKGANAALDTLHMNLYSGDAASASATTGRGKTPETSTR